MIRAFLFSAQRLPKPFLTCSTGLAAGIGATAVLLLHSDNVGAAFGGQGVVKGSAIAAAMTAGLAAWASLILACASRRATARA